jgi:hypothetical protein
LIRQFEDAASMSRRLRECVPYQRSAIETLASTRKQELTHTAVFRADPRAVRNPTAIQSRDPTGRSTMSIVVRFPPSNMTRQQYDSVRNALTESGDWPADGCQLHVLFGDENDLRVSEVWESREEFDAFGQKLGPRIEEAGMQLSGEPEVFEAHIFETF